ncbi:YdcF family protein [Candidatus Scalindua japonica]|uniref:YdcF family protein n=1 Tax=Candidatus Scalindua japonica TaxID=1284222 RepID=UPI0013A5A949|nr:YdcF family protein [Candidatus Scalindua japonica]
MILNLSGDFGRVVYTAELAHRYPKAQILITWAEIPFNSKILEEAGVEFPLNKDVMRKLLIVKGVEDHRIGVIGKWLTSTLEEALTLQKYWQSNSFNKLLVVTSPVHSRRAKFTFQEIFKDTDVEISVLSDPYDPFNPGKWWKDEGSLLNVVSEGLKILLYRYKFVTENF